jgi:hypothetical protein
LRGKTSRSQRNLSRQTAINHEVVGGSPKIRILKLVILLSIAIIILSLSAHNEVKLRKLPDWRKSNVSSIS